jgi:Phage-related lysozyme (muraminidase)
MTTADELVAHLKHYEGFVGHPYLCAAGKLTIGYGHRIDKPVPDITETQASSLLLFDIAKYTVLAVKQSPGLVDDAPRRLNAIIDFVFNCGPENYADSRLRAAVDRKDWPTAAMQNNRWVYITDPHTGQKNVSAWQKARRAATSEWLLKG